MRAILAAIIVLAASSAEAGFNDGNRLLELCKTNEPMVAGYITGALDRQLTDAQISLKKRDAEHVSKERWDAYQDNLDATFTHICSPEGVVMKQFVDVFCNYLQAHPEKRQMEGSVLVPESMVAAWPCSE
ncbi:Rap1a/Tai family immunity protein [Rhizobium leguminosarum]|uniref:Rap1a/Tai family immunity protein n=1 Tax=Rhizobium leguminosarum TaxID=384 RepID=UPI00161DDFF2|nr:Rap1a/Tai family immunity protein [Rhizobium leguminosarum]MBB4345186.1 hypothetical protein [Rhizobium leguminosarum]MBB6298257.1 hypothetical protein [Rhizobium leguminosarum]